MSDDEVMIVGTVINYEITRKARDTVFANGLEAELVAANWQFGLRDHCYLLERIQEYLGRI